MRGVPVSALIGLFFTAAYFLGAIFAPLVAPYGLAEVVGDVWEPASRTHLLGTDSIGRDLLTRMIYGGRTTIFIATMATLLSFVTGSVLGFLAAVLGGWMDQVMSRLVDLLMSIPTLIFALVVLSVMPVTIPVLIVVMGLLDSTRVSRLARAVAVDINVMDFVEAARGENPAGVDFQLGERHRRHRVLAFDVVPDERAHGVALALGLRDVLLRRPEMGRGDRHRLGQFESFEIGHADFC
jgi:peptide/nickel transport system permease protein